MKKIIITVLAIAISTLAFAASNEKTTKVKGYTKKNGTYVAPHTRTAPNKTKSDNYSTKGNYNPNTGKKGKKK